MSSLIVERMTEEQLWRKLEMIPVLMIELALEGRLERNQRLELLSQHADIVRQLRMRGHQLPLL